MIRFGLLAVFSFLPGSLSQAAVETFRAELFLDRRGNELNAGLYEGMVKGRRRFSETQVPSGLGTIYYFTTDRFNRQNYTGEWKDGTRHGNGTTHFKDGSVFTGEYKNGLEGGTGLISYPNGNRLEAEFDGGKVEGHGVFRYVNGDQREGYFSNNVLEGQVIFTRNDGVTVIETWKTGVRMEDKDIVVGAGTNIADVLAGNEVNNKIIKNNNNADAETNFNIIDSSLRNRLESADQSENAATSSFGGKNIPQPRGGSADQNRGVDLDAIRKAIRSGDRSAIFSSDRTPKAEDQKDFQKFGESSRRRQSEFLRRIFQSVNSRRK